MDFILVATFGLVFGSFFNVLADRLSYGKTILGRSKCESCKHQLSWNDLIPVLSFILLKGKCRYCKKSFSIQYPLSEIFTSAVFILTWYLSNHYLLGFVREDIFIHMLYLATSGVLIVMLLADLRYQIIPDEMQVALGVIGLTKIIYISYFIAGGNYIRIFTDLWSGVLSGAIVMAPLLLVFLITKGRGMGFGDVKLTFVMGLFLGMWQGLGALYIGFVTGGVVGAILLLLKLGGRKTKIPFGPYLILGFYLMIFFEQEVYTIVSRVYGF